jgi:hypothetical protein
VWIINISSGHSTRGPGPRRDRAGRTTAGRISGRNISIEGVMGSRKAKFQIAGLIVHLISAIALLLAFREAGGMVAFCVVSGALIGCGAVPARPGRPVTLYAAFGLLVGFAFWLFVSAVNQREFLVVIPAALLATGAVWLLQEPGWPPVLFTGVVALLCLGLVGLQYQHRYDLDGLDPETARRNALTTLVVLTVGLVYLALGFAEASLRKARKKVRRAIRTPVDPPLL